MWLGTSSRCLYIGLKNSVALCGLFLIDKGLSYSIVFVEEQPISRRTFKLSVTNIWSNTDTWHYPQVYVLLGGHISVSFSTQGSGVMNPPISQYLEQFTCIYCSQSSVIVTKCLKMQLKKERNYFGSLFHIFLYKFNWLYCFLLFLLFCFVFLL